MTKHDEAALASSGFVAAGEIFMDVVFAGLDSPVRNGEESFAKALELAPGGIANVSFTLARLGFQNSVLAEIGKDSFGQWIEDLFETEGIDLSFATRVDKSSVTASLTDSTDRAMVTFSPQHEEANLERSPLDGPIIVDLGSPIAKGEWWRNAYDSGTRVYADVRWEGTEDWRTRTLEQLKSCSVFAPNSKEALFLTGAESVEEAASTLAELVDLVVVTADEKGAFAYERSTGMNFWSPAIKVDAVDPTGAGDVFFASLAVARESKLSLEEAVSFATVASAISVTKFSGSVGAPTLTEISDWLEKNSNGADRYGFISDFVKKLSNHKTSENRSSNDN
jgi:sugar/nucleoside kinase (ribokinase family)